MTDIPVTFPTIHINGSSAESLLDPLETALSSLRSAITAVEETAPNSRDYYPQGENIYLVACREHVARVRMLKDVQVALGAIRESILEQQEKRTRW